ncbi:hypothetical protein QU593_10255 [Rossellomorea marisflavi]|jgi:hypothetical protein|uniref:hypothetical protein n=1 Tax=Rossellomorea marisflavi TaxID=189381 RepID=UPI0025B080D7|nr:hypothetical protein [Rossellomorea marisflavi]WJV20787.1 hypothetical protein QU593_10255 [Rossellomorea marisflavi]
MTLKLGDKVIRCQDHIELKYILKRYHSLITGELNNVPGGVKAIREIELDKVERIFKNLYKEKIN